MVQKGQKGYMNLRGEICDGGGQDLLPEKINSYLIKSGIFCSIGTVSLVYPTIIGIFVCITRVEYIIIIVLRLIFSITAKIFFLGIT